jgi:hypothetical protein
MKKLLVAFLTLASTATMAQEFQFGVKAGTNISNFTGASDVDELENSAHVGFHAGAFFSFLLGDHFAIQPELLFSSQGAKIKYANNEQNFRVSYVNLPVLAKYRFTGGFYLEAGPQVGFKVSDDVKDTPIEDFAKDLDLSIAAGLGYHSPIGLGIGGRYSAGLSKVGDFQYGTTRPDYRNSNIQIFLFYSFFNNKK